MKQLLVVITPTQDKILLEIVDRLQRLAIYRHLRTRTAVFNLAMYSLIAYTPALHKVQWPMKTQGTPAGRPPKPITKNKAAHILLAEGQEETLRALMQQLGVKSKSALFHLAMKEFIEKTPALQDLVWGDKPKRGGARGGAQAQSEQKARAKEALKHVIN